MIINNVAITSLLLGLLATTSPCVLPLYPGFLAYLSGQTETGTSRKRYFLGLLIGALFGMFFGAGSANPILGIGGGAVAGVFIGWFIAAIDMEKEKGKN